MRLRVPVPADDGEAGQATLTDIDVLSIDIDSRLRISRSSMECKIGKSQGEPSTILWLAGFRQLLELDHVALVRQTVSPRGQALARKLNIVAMDEAAVGQKEKAHAWLPERFAHLDGPACATAEARTDTQLKGLPEIPAGLARFLRGDALLADSPELLRAVQAMGAAVERQGVLPDPAAQVLASHSLIAVLLAALQDAGRLDHVPERMLRRRLISALTVGDPDDNFVLPVLERADAYFRHIQERTHKSYVDAGADPIRINYSSLRDAVATPPPFVSDYIDLVERLRANPQVSRNLLQTAELVCFDALLGDSAWKERAFAHLLTTEHKGLLLVGLRCLESIAGPQVVAPLQRLQRIPFEGSAGIVPDRGEPPRQQATLFGLSGSPDDVES
ncbi:hypothetical protein ACFWOJ_31745 [Streptomyces sp. NPDC058439]|uniref:hypothetical protein n=1 Tax=Streptomyces sp. NPDC058439 TaxID=3346500 RepID=UPI00365C2C57